MRPLGRIGLVAAAAFLFFTLGCADGRKRPPGYLRLGHVSGLLGRAQELKKFDLILRRDDGGLSAMSTQCTYDLSRLVLRKTDRGLILVSTLSSSTYDLDGKVLSGPAKVNLPYYELRFDAGVYGSPRDTLYVYVGREVSSDWRLPVTPEMERAAQTPETTPPAEPSARP
jgi:nitrite reductase/ring-hydroxylating ferredoxin subunit